jgi:hypothetical protein
LVGKVDLFYGIYRYAFPQNLLRWLYPGIAPWLVFAAATSIDGAAAAGTYDPAMLKQLGVVAIKPDLIMARYWYDIAHQARAPEAALRLKR